MLTTKRKYLEEGDYSECKEKVSLSEMLLYNIIPNSTYTYMPLHSSLLHSLSSLQCQHVDPNNLNSHLSISFYQGWKVESISSTVKIKLQIMDGVCLQYCT